MLFAGCRSDEIPNTTVADIDGNIYHTIKIGTQTWMVENLKTTRFNDGTDIPWVIYDSVWATITTPGFSFYENYPNFKNFYGVLYNWYAVNTNKLAPIGWHVPTDSDWISLEHYLIQNGYNYDGTTIGDKIAKSLASKTGWLSSTNKGAIGCDLTKNNSSGFTGFPCGFRTELGGFGNLDNCVAWWTSTDLAYPFSEDAWSHQLFSDSRNVERHNYDKRWGFSVRCIRDY